ncbi:hypothetical protein VNO77_35038 [Canavalia gladiata]|uniref:Uncharacterized protein n=1 Tax=Canavalia gladiata TaxID=3824 RepID=A0AAN9Q243_CANGL
MPSTLHQLFMISLYQTLNRGKMIVIGVFNNWLWLWICCLGACEKMRQMSEDHYYHVVCTCTATKPFSLYTLLISDIHFYNHFTAHPESNPTVLADAMLSQLEIRVIKLHPLSNFSMGLELYNNSNSFMASNVEMQSSYSSKKQDDSDFNLTEWQVKARISRENTKSRRYSASYIRSFREDTRSFRSNITISSTASSPGYPLKEEIDPSTYSFTTALKALQARSAYKTWECLSPDGFALNSKWNEAERYICNPLSGEVPMECLSAKTLSGRSFRNSTTNKITMSAPLVYSSRQIQTKPSTYNCYTQEDVALQFHIPEKEKQEMTKDAGTQSTPPYHSSSTPSTALTPSSIIKTSIKVSDDSLNSNAKTMSQNEVEVKDKETWDTTKETVREVNGYKKKEEQLCKQGGCFSWIRKKRHREKERQRRTNIFFTHFKVC